ncbi:hypothetical protein LTR50_002315 [Elasticomyces elasticus]|nr:hypothetical protein LTR50_002315 [Elasticomyces elasticus]
MVGEGETGVAFRYPGGYLLYQSAAAATPPLESLEASDDEIHAVFLPSLFSEVSPSTKKRQRLADAFDEATERRRKARRKGGESVSAAAAAACTKPDAGGALLHRRSVSASLKSINTAEPQSPQDTTPQTAPPSCPVPVPLQTHPLSRSSTTSSLPLNRTATLPTTEPRRSSLLRIQSIPPSIALSDTPTTIETRNKALLSRHIMAGMRLHGLSQLKPRPQTRNHSVAPSPSTGSFADSQATSSSAADKAKDEEYKLVYHQAFKGAVFAFRRQIATVLLLPYVEKVREVVDRLLVLYCADPLVGGLGGGGEDGVTPGGRKAFGAAEQVIEDGSVFPRPRGDGEGEIGTPSLRKKGEMRGVDSDFIQMTERGG